MQGKRYVLRFLPMCRSSSFVLFSFSLIILYMDSGVTVNADIIASTAQHSRFVDHASRWHVERHDSTVCTFFLTMFCCLPRAVAHENKQMLTNFAQDVSATCCDRNHRDCSGFAHSHHPVQKISCLISPFFPHLLGHRDWFGGELLASECFEII
jgi:hypothetical protein